VIILRCRWCDIFVLYIHAPIEDKIDDVKDGFYEELELVFVKFRKYYMYTANFGTEMCRSKQRRHFRPTIGMKVYAKLLMIMD
jgi:hypothetical protein